MRSVISLMLCSLLVLMSSMASAQETLRVLNWSDYVAPEVLQEFEKRFNTKIEYVEYSSVEDFGTRFLDSANQFDVIFPASRMLSALADAGLVRELDTHKLENLDQISDNIRHEFRGQNNGGWFGVPYLWGTTGLGLNQAALARVGIKPDEMNWSLLFDPEVRKKASSCGIVVLNERDELFAAALRFMGESVNVTSDEALNSAGALIKDALVDVKYLRSDGYVEALTAGEACVVMGYSGDLLSGISDKPDLSYVIPSQGAAMWIDLMAIPTNSTHVDLAYQFINYMMQAQNAARNSNYLSYPTVMASAMPLIAPEVLAKPEVYPPSAVLAKLEAMKPLQKDTTRLVSRLWTKAVCASGKYCSANVSSLF